MIQEGELVFIYVSDIGGEVQPKDLEGRLGEYGRACREKVPGASWIEEGVRIVAKDAVEVFGIKSSVEIKVFSIGGILVRINVPVRNRDFAQTLEIISRAEGDDGGGSGSGSGNVGSSGVLAVVSQGASSSTSSSSTSSSTTIPMAEFARDLARRIKEDIKPFITRDRKSVV